MNLAKACSAVRTPGRLFRGGKHSELQSEAGVPCRASCPSWSLGIYSKVKEKCQGERLPQELKVPLSWAPGEEGHVGMSHPVPAAWA